MVVKIIANVQESENPELPGQITPDVQPGNCYLFLCSIDTRANEVHEAGDFLVVMDQTTATPHHEISQSGKNWICDSVYGQSVWATLEQLISRGWLKKV